MAKAAASYAQQLEAFRDVDLIVHGTTLGTNVVLTGRGAKVGVVTTKGFRDVIGTPAR